MLLISNILKNGISTEHSLIYKEKYIVQKNWVKVHHHGVPIYRRNLLTIREVLFGPFNKCKARRYWCHIAISPSSFTLHGYSVEMNYSNLFWHCWYLLKLRFVQV